MARREFTHVAWDTKTFGPNEELGLENERQWRDASLISELKGRRVVPKDTQHGFGERASEPDWKLGFYLQDERGQPDPLWNCDSDTPEFFRECWRRGLVIDCTAIANDLQDHN